MLIINILLRLRMSAYVYAYALVRTSPYAMMETGKETRGPFLEAPGNYRAR